MEAIEARMTHSITAPGALDEVLHLILQAYFTPPPVLQSNAFGKIFKQINTRNVVGVKICFIGKNKFHVQESSYLTTLF
jgi:hypothetical protein